MVKIYDKLGRYSGSFDINDIDENEKIDFAIYALKIRQNKEFLEKEIKENKNTLGKLIK